MPTVREAVKKHCSKIKDLDKLEARVIKETGCGSHRIQEVFVELGLRAKKASGFKARNIPGAQTIKSFSQPFDYPQQILDALVILRESDHSVCSDNAFRKFCKISTSNWKAATESRKLAKFHRRMPNNQILWGDPEQLNQAEERCFHIYE